jgi:hypothetical protein
MKKHLQLSIILFSLLFVSKLNAQTFNLSNYAVNLYEPTNQYGIDSHVSIDNISSFAANFYVERTINYLVPLHDESFCVGLSCYAAGTTTSGTIQLLAGRSIDLKAAVEPNGHCGTSSIHYRIVNVSNAADSVGIDLNFNFCATGIAENKEELGMSKALRNPADGFTLFNYNLPTNEIGDKLVVFNMLGSFIKSMDVNGLKGTIVMNTSDLTSGIYLVSYMSGNKVRSTSKLVVRHN